MKIPKNLILSGLFVLFFIAGIVIAEVGQPVVATPLPITLPANESANLPDWARNLDISPTLCLANRCKFSITTSNGQTIPRNFEKRIRDPNTGEVRTRTIVEIQEEQQRNIRRWLSDLNTRLSPTSEEQVLDGGIIVVR